MLVIRDIFYINLYSCLVLKIKAKKRSNKDAGEIKIEPEEFIYVIMTNDEIYKYKTKEIFDKAVEKIKACNKISFYRTQAFSDSNEADKAYKILMAHYNGLSEDEKKRFEASSVDLESTAEKRSADANRPPKKTQRTSNHLTAP